MRGRRIHAWAIHLQGKDSVMALKNQDYFSEKYEKIEQAVLAAHSMGSFAVGIMAHYNVHFACEFSCVEVDVKTGKLSVSQLADTDSYSPGCKIIYKNRYVLCWCYQLVASEHLSLDEICIKAHKFSER